MTAYGRLKNKVNTILNRKGQVGFFELFLALNRYAEINNNSIAIRPDGTVIFLDEFNLYENTDDLDENLLTLQDKKQFDSQEISYNGVYRLTSLKLDPTKPLSEQNKQGDETLDALAIRLS